MMSDANGLKMRVEDLVRAAGIENFRFERNVLVMCGVRYAIEPCLCGEPGCHGLRLRRKGGAWPAPQAPRHAAFPLGRA